MEPSQIQRSLFENSGRQISPARFELVIVGSVHVECFVISFSIFRRSTSQGIYDFPPNTVSAGQSSSDLQFSILRLRRLGYPNDAAGSSFESVASVWLRTKGVGIR